MSTRDYLVKMARDYKMIQQSARPLSASLAEAAERLQTLSSIADKFMRPLYNLPLNNDTIAAKQLASLSVAAESMLNNPQMKYFLKSGASLAAAAAKIINIPQMKYIFENGAALNSLARELHNTINTQHGIAFNSLIMNNKDYDFAIAAAERLRYGSRFNPVYGIQEGLSVALHKIDSFGLTADINFTRPHLNNWFPGTFAGDILEDEAEKLNEPEDQGSLATIIEESGAFFTEYIVDTPFDYSTRYNAINLLLQLLIAVISFYFSQPDYSLLLEEMQNAKNEIVIQNEAAINSAKQEILSAINKNMEKSAEQFNYYIIIRPVTLKEEPSALANSICFLHPKQRVRLLHHKGKWAKIITLNYQEGGQQEGWVHQLNLKRIPKKL